MAVYFDICMDMLKDVGRRFIESFVRSVAMKSGRNPSAMAFSATGSPKWALASAASKKTPRSLVHVHVGNGIAGSENLQELRELPRRVGAVHHHRHPDLLAQLHRLLQNLISQVLYDGCAGAELQAVQPSLRSAEAGKALFDAIPVPVGRVQTFR